MHLIINQTLFKLPASALSSIKKVTQASHHSAFQPTALTSSSGADTKNF